MSDQIELDEVEVLSAEPAVRYPRSVLSNLVAVLAELEVLATDGHVPDHAIARLISERGIKYAQRALGELDDTGIT